MSKVEAKLIELGYTLPECPSPAGAYVPGVRLDNGLLFVSGQTAIQDGKVISSGRVGENVSVEEAYEAAKLSVLRLLAEAKAVLGTLDRIERIVKVNGYVNCVGEFKEHPKVINGASEFLLEIFGDSGKHSRTAIGVSALPDNAPVEVEMIIAYK